MRKEQTRAVAEIALEALEAAKLDIEDWQRCHPSDAWSSTYVLERIDAAINACRIIEGRTHRQPTGEPRITELADTLLRDVPQIYDAAAVRAVALQMQRVFDAYVAGALYEWECYQEDKQS